MAVEWVALGGLAVGALGLLTPLVTGRAERRASHRAWLPDVRLTTYAPVLSALRGVQKRGGLPVPADVVLEVNAALHRLLLLGSDQVAEEVRTLSRLIVRRSDSDARTPEDEEQLRTALKAVETAMRRDLVEPY